MPLSFRRTVASELTLWLSTITTVLAVIIGLSYYCYVSGAVTRELVREAERTADELSRVLVAPLYNFDRATARAVANIYLSSGRVSGIAVKAEGMGEVFNNLSSVSSSLPLIKRSISRQDLLLGSMELIFNDRPVLDAKKRAVWTMLVSVFLILLLYMLSLRLILRRILVGPLTGVGDRLQNIAAGSSDAYMDPVPQQDLNTIVTAANKLSEEIAERTRTLRENERNYREIYNATSDAIFIHDAADGSIVDVNQTMLDMYGYSRQEAMALQVGELSQGKSPYSEQEAVVMLEKTLREGPQVFKWMARRKNGSLFRVEMSLKTTLIGDQQVVLALVRDISSRERLEEQLRHSQKMEAIGTLAGGIAHDFNNILTAILGYTELAQMKVDKESGVLADLQQVEQASLRARELVKQILTFSRKQQQKKEVLLLASVVGEAVNLLRSSIPVTVNIKQNLNSQARVEVDSGQIHQVIMNLCTNGYQSMPERSGTLVISLKDKLAAEQDSSQAAVDLAPGKYALLEIRDDGIGMDEETKNKMFEPYFTTKGVENGTGLGLAVVHGIVKSHQGMITVHSKPGQGTTFRVYLPVSNASLTGNNRVAVDVGRHGNRRIMVVDDEESIRNLMDEILCHGGYRVDVFADGTAAWSAFSADPQAWDMLITDLTMPGMTGAELSRKAARLRPGLPIIICTGYNEMLGSAQEQELPTSVCLQKPVTMQELLEAAAEVLQEGESQ